MKQSIFLAGTPKKQHQHKLEFFACFFVGNTKVFLNFCFLTPKELSLRTPKLIQKTSFPTAPFPPGTMLLFSVLLFEQVFTNKQCLFFFVAYLVKGKKGSCFLLLPEAKKEK